MPAPANHVPHIRALCAHITTLGISDGDPLPSAAKLGEATGIPRRGVFKVLADLKERGAISDHETPGHPPRVRLLDLIAEIGTVEGYARHVASPKEPGTDKPKAGSAGAWADVMARVDTLSADLSVALEDIAASTATLSALPQILEALPGLVEAAVARALGSAPPASVAAPKQVRQRVQTKPGTHQNPNVAALTKTLGYKGTGTALGVSYESARRYAIGERSAPEDVELAAQRILDQHKNA